MKLFGKNFGRKSKGREEQNSQTDEIWFNKERLVQDHIDEVIEKINHLDDDIWAKLVYFQKNKRIAKAYLRSTRVQIDNSEQKFDGERVGISSFGDIKHSKPFNSIQKKFKDGITLEIDKRGNIHIQRLTKCEVNISIPKNVSYDTCASPIGDDIIQINGRLKRGQQYKLFDMEKFRYLIEHQSYTCSSRDSLEQHCLIAFSIGSSGKEILDNPCWFALVNVIAIDANSTANRNIKKSISMQNLMYGSLHRLNMPYHTLSPIHNLSPIQPMPSKHNPYLHYGSYSNLSTSTRGFY